MALNAFLFCGGKKPQGVIEITGNGETDVSDYATASVSVSPVLQSRTVTPSTSSVTVTADAGYDGLSSVTVNAVGSGIDANISPSNIRSGVTILGVTGTLAENEAPPDHVICDGDTVSTIYFNTEVSDSYMSLFLSSLTYGEPETGTGIRYSYLGPGYMLAAELNGVYALVWGDINDPCIIYATDDVPGLGIAAGWGASSFSPSSPVLFDYDSMTDAMLAVKNLLFAKASIAYGAHGGGGSCKAHTFTVPSVSGAYTYTGSSQSPVISGYYSDFMTVTGDTVGVNAGSYTFTVSLIDTVNCQWSDGTVTSKTLSWSIAKAPLPAPSLSTPTVRLSPVKTSEMFTVSRVGGGTVSAVPSDPSLISVSVSGTAVTVTAISASSAASAYVTVYVAESANYLAYTDSGTVCGVEIYPAAFSTFRVQTASQNISVPFCFRQSAPNGVTIDWGDGSSTVTAAGTYVDISYPKYNVQLSHTYSEAGVYDILITPGDNVIWAFGRQSNGTTFYNVFNLLHSSLTSAGSGEPSGVKAVSFDGGFGLHNVGYYAFKQTSISSFKVVGSDFSTVGLESFSYCSLLMTVELPESTDTFCNYAFASCPYMLTLKVRAAVPPNIGNYSLSTMRAACLIYVPSGSVETYKTADYWSARASYIRAIT